MRKNAVSGTLTISAFARAAGVNVETIRFYQRKGLLPEPHRPHGSIRRYAETDAARVEFKLTDVRSKLADLRRIESVLVRLIRDCCVARGKVSCPLIAALDGRPF